MSQSRPPTASRVPPGSSGTAAGRVLGLLLLLLLMLLLMRSESALERSLRHATFDAYQREFPRERAGDGVIVMAIDDLSLQRHGQWPWPRKELALLVERLAAQRPAAIGIDMIFAEPDRMSPGAQVQRLEREGYLGPQRSRPRLPDYDQLFAQALRGAGVALGVGGLPDDRRLRDPVDYRVPIIEVGGSASAFVRRYPSALRSVETIDRAAGGHGLINADVDDDGVVRSVPALAQVGDRLLPGLAVETLRQTAADPVLRVIMESRGLQAIEVAGHRLPVAVDGSWWIHYSDPRARPIFPVALFLDGTLPADLVRGRIVLIGAAATGLRGHVITPMGPMPGVSVHAEALDNLLDGRLLWRPGASVPIEAGLLVLLCLVSILGVPVMRPSRSVLMFVSALGACAALGAAAFVWRGWLIDVATPAAGATLVFAVMLSIALGQTQRQRRSLRQALALSREQQARIEGELDAARRIQVGMLPDPAAVVGGETRVDLYALMQPARTVGGDLYDFIRLDDDRLFFMIGDVSGKGLPASLFMALSKALIKNSVLHADGDPGRALSLACRVIARENPEAMFVTVTACTLDLSCGQLAWCSAGHDGPQLVRAGCSAPETLWAPGGPPLCMLDRFDYPTERLQLTPGDLLCLVTDGVTEAQDARGQLYGAARLASTLGRAVAAEHRSRRIVERVLRDVQAFTGGLEPADDLSLLALRWRGDGGSP